MTKTEVYSGLIDIQKKTGQGLSGIVTVMGETAHLFRKYLDELIEEGLVDCYDSGGSLGHPESNRWYMPTKGYNVWKDGIENENSDTAYLTYVRFYLGQIDLDEEPEDRENLAKWLNPSAQLLIQNPDFIKGYSKWLKRNSEELEIMKNLDSFYDEPTIQFSEEEKEWIKTRGWYENNESVSDCLNKSLSAVDDDKERLKLNKELINLYKKSGAEKYKEELKKTELEVENFDKAFLRRKRLNKWLEKLDKNKSIQECI
jgi:hypothetical protein